MEAAGWQEKNTRYKCVYIFLITNQGKQIEPNKQLPEVMTTRQKLFGNSAMSHNIYCGHLGINSMINE